jgi:hypothetical protein
LDNIRGRIFAAFSALVLCSGCAVQATKYQPSIDNVEQIKKATTSAALGSFTVQPGAVGGSAVTLRTSTMNSPVGTDYAAYLADALRQELALAGKLDPKSTTEISGMLLKNDISAGGFSVNSGEIEARFIVKKDGASRFDKTERAELSWESSFAAMVAIPKAQQQYPLMVQKLIQQLLADAEFVAALQ